MRESEQVPRFTSSYNASSRGTQSSSAFKPWLEKPCQAFSKEKSPMANISKRNRRREREIMNAAKNRREIIKAQLSRRDMMKAGLLTSAGYLIHKRGLSARAQFSGDDCDDRWRDGSDGTPESPPTTPFLEPMPIPPVAQPVATL